MVLVLSFINTNTHFKIPLQIYTDMNVKKYTIPDDIVELFKNYKKQYVIKVIFF